MRFQKKVLIIDGRNLFLRSIHLCEQIISQVKDYPSRHFLNTIMFTLNQIIPSQVVFVFDGYHSNFRRRQIYSQYKIKPQPKEQPTITYSQIDFNKQIIYKYLQLLPFKFIRTQNYQADDVISYIVNNHYKDYDQIIIMSSDKDFYQLLANNVKIYNIIRKQHININMFMQRFRIPPEIYIYYKILLGDNSDCLPGINGIGDRTIKKLFFQLYNKNECKWWKNLEQFISLINNNKYDNKVCRKIFNNIQILRRNYMLMNLRQNYFLHDTDKINIDKTIKQISDFNFIKLLRLQSKYNFLERFKNKFLMFKTIQNIL